MLAQAPNIEYQQAAAEHTGLPDSSVDLITVAQALHWFDLDAFYTEARRVLRPGGTLAAWTYTLGHIKVQCSSSYWQSKAEREINRRCSAP